jgi:hypothetical protein
MVKVEAQHGTKNKQEAKRMARHTLHPEDGDDTFIQNVSELAQNYTELQTRQSYLSSCV